MQATTSLHQRTIFLTLPHMLVRCEVRYTEHLTCRGLAKFPHLGK